MKGTIVYIGGFRLPDKNAAASRVINNAKILRRLGYKIVFIDVSDDAGTDVLETKHDIMGFDCYSVKYPKGIEWYRYLTSIKALKKVLSVTDNVEAIIVYNYQAAALAKVLGNAKKKGIKVISDCTEWYAKSKNPIKNIDTGVRMKLLHKKTDGIIAISRYLYDYYKESTNTVYIPPLTDTSDMKWKQEYPESDKLLFTYAGSPGKSKDKLNVFIEALTEIKTDTEYEMQVVGITKEQYLTSYPEHKKNLELLGEKINFKGRIPHTEVISSLKKSDFSVFVRENNLQNKAGFPTKFAEAVTAGVPVITNASSDLSEYLCDMENCVLIKDCEKQYVKEALERALNISQDEYRKIKNKCEEMKETFHYEKYIDEMKKLF